MLSTRSKIKIVLLFIVQIGFSNTPPIAVNDANFAKRNTNLEVASPGVLENDTDLDGDVLTVISFFVNGFTYTPNKTANFKEGSISISSDGSYTFIPTPNYLGIIPTITYVISDALFTTSANLNLSVILPPTTPVARNDFNKVELNKDLIVSSLGVLANDTDEDGDALTVTQFSINGIAYNFDETAILSEGSISIAANGSYVFKPTIDYLGPVSIINYTISDGTASANANLSLSVVLPPAPPIAIDDENATEKNKVLNVSAPGVLLNDSDENGDVLKISQFAVNGTAYLAGETATFIEGSITISANGSYIFTPAKDYFGAVPIINYTITDTTFSANANLMITVVLPPTPPVAVNDYDTVEINTTLTVPAPGVFINDSDVNGDELKITKFLINGLQYNSGQTAILQQGKFTLFVDGSYTFEPKPDYTGDVPVIFYTVSDGIFSATASLFFTVEHITNLLEISELSSCNQGFTSAGEYKVRYSIVLLNKSFARDYHQNCLIKNIDIVNDLQATFGNSCVVKVSDVTISNKDFITIPGGYPLEFKQKAINSDFLNITSSSIFNSDAIDNLTLYPRQNVTVSFCVTVKPFCDGRPNPTPSGSGVDFENIINVTSDRGNVSKNIVLNDFHTTEAVVTAGLFIPEFNDSVNPPPPGVINFDGTYDYANRVIITNEGTKTAENINFNMGLGSFFDNGIVFTEIRIEQVAGPTVTINPNYDGKTETLLLSPNNTLASGEKIILELFYLIAPYNSNTYSYFNQFDKSQTQGGLDGFDETTAKNKRNYSFVVWSDGLGNHLDRYYKTNSATASISSSAQCNCNTSGMRFKFTSNSSTEKTISEVIKKPNGILEHEEITYQIKIKNTSESVQLVTLQIQDVITNSCGGNIVSFTKPVILNTTASTNPTLNLNFNGSTDSFIFSGTDGVLKKNETVTVQFSVTYYESCIGVNKAIFTARNPLNGLVTSSKNVNINASTDSDGDGIIDTIDLDDDNDTIPDIAEYNGLGPFDDHDNDLIPNYRDTDFGVDTIGDGIVDIFDFDNDGVPNHLDLDSDNDGILDIVEAGNSISDTDKDGKTNKAVGANGLDNTRETNDTVSANINYAIPNSDADNNPNFLDIDADADGIVDTIEAQLTASFISLNAIFSDNGIDTAFPNGIIPIDTDLDGISDYLDTNSDNDIRDDIVEGWDINDDGIPEKVALNIDSDKDGLDDAFDIDNNLYDPSNGQNPMSFPNLDNTDTPERDWREIIAIKVILDSVSASERNNLIFTFSLVTKNDEATLIESASPILINLSTLNGTDTTNIYDVANSPFDFIGFTNISFTISPNTSSASFTITTIDDTIFEQPELFTLKATIISNNTINNELLGIGTILDNDEPPSITMNNSRENEGVVLAHTISLSHPSSTPILIDVRTVDNTAKSPDDYATFSEILTIDGTIDPNNSNTLVSFSISSKNDNLNESDEEEVNVLGIVTSKNVGNQDLNKKANIVDIDPNPTIVIDDVTVEEGEILKFSIRLLNANLEPMQNDKNINLTLETIDVTTFANEDYESKNVFRTIPAFSFSINEFVNSIDDRLNEKTETFYLQVNTNLDNVSNTFSPRGIGTITDNDYPNLFSPNADGKSDYFVISGIKDVYPNFKLTIFNRQGNEVYHYSNKGNPNPIWWDGTFHGNPAPTGVYFYILDYNDGTKKPKTNFIQLIR